MFVNKYSLHHIGLKISSSSCHEPKFTYWGQNGIIKNFIDLLIIYNCFIRFSHKKPGNGMPKRHYAEFHIAKFPMRNFFIKLYYK